jgi:hypothetical protein
MSYFSTWKKKIWKKTRRLLNVYDLIIKQQRDSLKNDFFILLIIKSIMECNEQLEILGRLTNWVGFLIFGMTWLLVTETTN